MNALLQRVPARDMSPPMPQALHPAAQQAAAAWSDLCHTNERLANDLAQTKADLEVERRHVADLQRLLTIERGDKERYQRYAVRAMAHFENICTSAKRGHDEAMKFADELPPPEPPRNVQIDAAKLEAELADAVRAAKEDQPRNLDEPS